jgi:N utilization substance protein B
MQILFLWDALDAIDPKLAEDVARDLTDPVVRQRAMEMATGAWEARVATDHRIERLAPQWPPQRQARVDRNIFRLAVWELVHTSTPGKVIIDEAIEMAREFSTEQSPSFVNGVLDAVMKEVAAAVEADLPVDPESAAPAPPVRPSSPVKPPDSPAA